MLKELRYYADRLEPCNIYDKNDMIKIYFHQVQSKACFILKEFSKGADSFCVVESGLPDDETINYVVKFHKSRLEDIAFVQYCISKDGRIGGCALYNIPIVEYWAALECDISPQVYVSAESKAYYREIFEHIYRICDEKINYYVLPKKMPFKDKMQSMQGNAIEDFLNKSYPPYKDRFEKKEKNKLKVFDGVLLAQAYKKDNEKFYQMLDMFNNKYNLIYQELLARGEFSPKWKSEYELFQLLKKEYTDAIYQYRARWLGHQSLDIFVPSKMLAFEYQGLQHFKPIEVFGGEEHFQRQIKLDKKKRELCIQNDVKLIEWKYDEPISRIFLRKKLKNI